MITRINKNTILIFLYVISLIPKEFYGTDYRVWLSIFHGRENTTRLDMFCLYYINQITFIIIAYCLHYNKGLNKVITRLILILTVLDFWHLVLYAKQGFEIPKIALAILILLGYEIIKKRYK